MIRIVRGMPVGAALELDARPLGAGPWAGARHLVACCRSAYGDEPVSSAIRPHRTLLSLVLRDLEPDLPPDERRRREQESGNVLGALPYPVLNARPLVEAWAAMLDALLAGRQATIVVPDAAHLDGESLLIVRPLLRRSMAAGNLQFLIDWDPDVRPAELGRKLAWSVNAREMATLRSLPCTVTGPAADRTEPRAESHDGREQPLPTIDDVRTAFGSFALPEALASALRVLEAEPDHPDAAELHNVAGVCAHNFRFAPGSEKEVQALARHHFRAALERETTPRRRATLLCRASLQAAFSKELTGAKDFSAQALSLARTLDGGGAGYFEAWAHNARAFAAFRENRLDEAGESCAAGLAVIESSWTSQALAPDEAPLTACYLLDNLTRVALDAGDVERACECQEQVGRWAQRVSAHRRPRCSTYALATVGRDLSSAVRRFRASYEEARDDLLPSVEAVWAHALGQVHYRRGEAAEAYELFAVALRIWSATGEDQDDIVTGTVNCAQSALRARRLTDARRHFEDLQSHPKMTSPAVQAALAGALGVVAAKDGREEDARMLTSDATRLAAEASLNARLRAIRAEGEILIALGQPDAAARVLRAGWDLMHAAPGPDTLDPTAALGLALTLLEAGPVREDVVAFALEHVPRALAEDDANVWWDVESLSRFAQSDAIASVMAQRAVLQRS